MLLQLFLVALPLLAVSVFAKLYYQRFIRYAGLPQVKPSLIWGNLLTLHENMQRLRPDEHAGQFACPCSFPPTVLDAETMPNVNQMPHSR